MRCFFGPVEDKGGFAGKRRCKVHGGWSSPAEHPERCPRVKVGKEVTHGNA